MGTTLENGVYLPSEGERNCYAGLKTNWEILDQKVADVTALQQAVAGALHREIVESLPTTDIDPNTIYMILSGTSATENVYNEYMYVNNAWELIGTSATDLTNYYTKAEVDGKLLLKANDSDVVHKSEAENITGKKTFLGVSVNFKSSVGVYGSTSGNASINFYDKNSMLVSYLRQGLYNNGLPYIKIALYGIDANNQTIENSLAYAWFGNVNQAYFRPETDNFVYLGTENNRWKSVYATNYYYGSNNVEFSTKFVTTDTNQTISGSKTFSSNVNVYNSDSSTDTANIVLKNSKAERGSTTNIGEQTISFLDKDNAQIGQIKCDVDANGFSNLTLQCSDINDTSGGVQLRRTVAGVVFQPTLNSLCYLGQSIRRWYSTYTNKINNLEPSSLSLPGDRSARIDISSYITNLGNGDNNQYIVPANGYIWLHFTSINSVLCFSQTSGALTNYAQTFVRSSGDGVLYVFFPVRKDDKFVARIYTSSTAVVQNAYFIPCQGNV